MPAAIEACRARRVLALPGGEDLAQDDLGHLLALDTGTLQRRLDRDAAEFVGGKIGEGAVEGADRGARGADDDDVVLHAHSYRGRQPNGLANWTESTST
jgi:hypothetical protein